MINIEDLGKQLYQYCTTYKIPVEYIFDILNDQKVVPMIRGKATEFTVYLLLSDILNSREWSVEKLNLNPQPGVDDEDISVTHKRTGIILKVECKNAVRGSIRSGKRARITKVPHCQIKCHKSRSNTKKLDQGNDKYTIDAFDIVISNMANAIIQGGSIDENFELVDDNEVLEILSNYYQVSNDFSSLFDAASDDWRFALTKDIEQNGFVPRTPTVQLENDPSWKPLKDIEVVLLDIIKERTVPKKNGKKSRR